MKRRVLRFAVLLTVALSASLAAQQGPANQTFCVAGMSNGIGWSWGIINNGGLQSRAIVPALPNGAGCNALAQAFVNSINANPAINFRCTAQVSPVNPCCFTICCPNGFDFWIGDAAGNPNGVRCKVTGNAAGCQFNPLVIETENQGLSPACPVPVPTPTPAPVPGATPPQR